MKMEKGKEKTNNEELAVEVCASFWEQFEPAETLDDATNKWTSGEIATAVFQLTGTPVGVDTIFQVMKETGFKYELDTTTAGVKYVWLLKVRAKR